MPNGGPGPADVLSLSSFFTVVGILSGIGWSADPSESSNPIFGKWILGRRCKEWAGVTAPMTSLSKNSVGSDSEGDGGIRTRE